jgi:antitoxin (DNA-binding transcriptional repressor) of toxin-antitoxin stability system
VLDRVERGESLTVTRDGHPVAELRPEMRIVVNWTEELKRLVPAVRRLSP